MIDAGDDDRGVDKALETLTGDEPDTPGSLIPWAESFLENAPTPASIIQRAGYRLLYANPAFGQLHLMPATPRDVPISDLFDPTTARLLEGLVDTASSSPTRAHEGSITTRSGDRAIRCAVWPLADKDGREISIVMLEMRPLTDYDATLAFQVDMTERLLLSALRDQMVAESAEAAAKVAQMANAAKARFLSTMSHELRTPLNAIGGYAELIDMGLRGPVTDAQHEDLSRIQRAQAHLLGLIDSVLTFAKLESGTVPFEMSPVSLDATLRGVQEMLMPHLERQGLAYRDMISMSTTEPLVVNADPEKLRQILINVLTNAIKFTPPSGTISVRCDARGELVSVDISDTGRGIPADQLSTVFDPFVQVGRRLNSNDHGVGLGLSISRDLARGMGGDLTATSTLGEGSTFTLTLTRASTGAPPSP